MKNKIPTWTLYVADAMMFFSVLLLTLTYVKAQVPMSGLPLLLCVLLVLCGMALTLFPFWLEYKNDLAKKAEHSSEATENFKVIFEDLVALRLGLAELEEAQEKIFEKLNESPNNAIEARLTNFEEAVATFRDSIKKRFKEINEAINNNTRLINACELSDKELKESLSNLESDFAETKENLLDEIESISVAASELSEILTNLETKSEEAVDEAAEEIEEELEEPESSIEQEIEQAPQIGSMLGRALAGAEISKASVEKFVQHAKSSDANSEQAEIDVAEEKEEVAEKIPEETPQDTPPPQELKIEYDQPEVEETAQQENSDELQDFFELENKTSPEVEEAKQESDANSARRKIEDEDFFDLADSGKKSSESADFDPQNSLNFPDLLLSRKSPKPRKADAAVIVNAIIGIGNKPYLRGNGGGLSEKIGLAMEYVEIGKWRYVFGEIEEPITFSVLKNDETSANESQTFTISSGEKLELNLTFPQQD